MKMMIVMMDKKKACWSVVGTWCGKLSGTHKRPLRANCWEQWSCREKDENGGRKKGPVELWMKAYLQIMIQKMSETMGWFNKLPWAIAWEQLRERSTKQNRLFTFIRSSIWQTSALHCSGVIQREERGCWLGALFLQKVRTNWQEIVASKEWADYTSEYCFALIYY